MAAVGPPGSLHQAEPVPFPDLLQLLITSISLRRFHHPWAKTFWSVVSEDKVWVGLRDTEEP